MEFNEAVLVMEEGFCLWVGAGLSKQISGGYADVPLWEQITSDMEKDAGLVDIIENIDYPNRLQKCYDAVGHKDFHKILRKKYYTELCKAILIQADDRVNLEDFIPTQIRQLAALGQLANPIVSFNIEPISSLLLSRPGGPVRILDSTPNGKPFKRKELFEKFQRLVYHPHGLATDLPVMTIKQYQSNEITLAFGLAIHSAFRNNLVIVGMSLDDEYLQEQLAKFRPQIETVIWFNSKFSEKSSNWANKNNITMVTIDWGAFWNYWGKRESNIIIDETQLKQAWYLAVHEATNELNGGTLKKFSTPNTEFKKIPEGLLNIYKKAEEKSRSTYEPGELLKVRDKFPNDIEKALINRFINDKISLPKFVYTNI